MVIQSDGFDHRQYERGRRAKSNPHSAIHWKSVSRYRGLRSRGRLPLISVRLNPRRLGILGWGRLEASGTAREMGVISSPAAAAAEVARKSRRVIGAVTRLRG
jgi:hypothetical protein